MSNRPRTRSATFQARGAGEDFTRPSREQILRDVGLTPEGVDRMLEQVKRQQRD